MPFFVKAIPFFGSVFSVLLIFLINSECFRNKQAHGYRSKGLRALHRFLSYKWFFDTVYNRFVNWPLMKKSYSVVFSLLDKGLLESFGPTGFSSYVSSVSHSVTARQSGRMYDYAWIMFFSVYAYLLITILL